MSFELIRKNFGFGFMRLPMLGDQVDIAQTNEMVDAFLKAGFNYFDTAHGYIDGKSELTIRECLTSRYPRERYILTNKLSGNFFNSREEIRPLLEEQLEKCGVEYFDFYLLHAMNAERFANYQKMNAVEECLQLKAEGKIRHLGMSFHDKSAVLDRILTDCPYIEVVQIQFNYVDYEDDKVESRKCYEVCRKHGKPVMIMEPVKGGSLVNLPASAQRVFDKLEGGSNASYAIRFAAGFEGVIMVLSGMSTIGQAKDNISFMADFQPLNAQEQAAVDTVCAIFRNQELIPCTTCRYCTEVCPQGIAIPELFACLNAKKQENASAEYPEGTTPASECIKCGQCETACPQNLNIRELLTVAAAELEV